MRIDPGTDGRLALAAGLTALALVGCDPGERRPPERETGAAVLTGMWDATFAATRPFLGHDSGAVVSGRLVLMPTRALGTDRRMPAPTHFGAYEVDYRPLGFQLSAAGDVPTLRAALRPGDSVVMAFDASDPAHQLVLHGIVSGDTIRGRWEYVSRAGGAGGDVVLHRDAAGR
jgi:hypothetical protein